jgi:hypothetical protein
MAKKATDTDLKAIAQIRAALEDFSSSERYRILDYVKEKMQAEQAGTLTFNLGTLRPVKWDGETPIVAGQIGFHEKKPAPTPQKAEDVTDAPI